MDIMSSFVKIANVVDFLIVEPNYSYETIGLDMNDVFVTKMIIEYLVNPLHKATIGNLFQEASGSKIALT